MLLCLIFDILRLILEILYFPSFHLLIFLSFQGLRERYTFLNDLIRMMCRILKSLLTAKIFDC